MGGVKLSDEQMTIIEQSVAGSHAVLACAGSGKTLVLIERLKRVADDRKSLCLAFTRNAAREMKMRTNAAADFRTIDSVAYQTVKEHGWKIGLDIKRWRVVTYPDKMSLAREVVRSVMPKNYSPSTFIKRMDTLKRLNQWYYNLTTGLDECREMVEFCNWMSDDPEFVELAYEYERRRREDQLLDFEDMELVAYEMLYSEMACYAVDDLSIDESQDLSALQWDLISVISADHVFAVGSPEQSIYSFRQARPELFYGFIDRNEMTIHRLKKNFRSARTLIALSNRVFPISEPVKRERGHAYDLGHYMSMATEAKHVVDMMMRHLDRTVGVLVRMNMQLLPVVKELMERKIKYATAKSIFDRVSMKLLMNWLRASNDVESSRYVSGVMGIRPEVVSVNSSSAAQTGDAKIAISVIRKSYGVDTFLAMNLPETDDYDDEMWLLDQFEEMGAGKTVDEFLTEIEAMRNLEEDSAPVWVGTIHSAKGMEFDTVFVCGVTEGILPHAKGDQDEEKRLFYVAITRAKTNLYLSSSVIRRSTNRSEYYNLVSDQLEKRVR